MKKLTYTNKSHPCVKKVNHFLSKCTKPITKQPNESVERAGRLSWEDVEIIQPFVIIYLNQSVSSLHWGLPFPLLWSDGRLSNAALWGHVNEADRDRRADINVLENRNECPCIHHGKTFSSWHTWAEVAYDTFGLFPNTASVCWMANQLTCCSGKTDTLTIRRVKAPRADLNTMI